MAVLYKVAKKIKTRLTALERTKLVPGKGAVTRTIGLPTSLPVPLFLCDNTASHTSALQR